VEKQGGPSIYKHCSPPLPATFSVPPVMLSLLSRSPFLHHCPRSAGAFWVLPPTCLSLTSSVMPWSRSPRHRSLLLFQWPAPLNPLPSSPPLWPPLPTLSFPHTAGAPHLACSGCLHSAPSSPPLWPQLRREEAGKIAPASHRFTGAHHFSLHCYRLSLR
jgi:hypothetical protein